MQKIIPNFWFQNGNDVEEAVKLYTSLYPNSKIGPTMRYDKASAEVSGQPEGSILTIEFELDGQKFIGINGGPTFKMNPSVSFHVKAESKEKVDELWEKLLPGGKVLMELGSYPFSDRYGWIEDRFGVSWQIIDASQMSPKPRFTPVLMFTQGMAGRAEEAGNFYTSIFPNSKAQVMMRYGKEQPGEKEGTIAYEHLWLNGDEIGVMDSASPHQFTFNEGISLLISCDTQEEIDHYWNALTADGGAESVCGWLKDKFGVSWQVAPKILDEMIRTLPPEQSQRVMKAMLQMKKIVIADLEKAAQG